MGFNHQQRRLIIRVHVNGGVIETPWSADLYIDQNAVVDVQDDGSLIYPVSSRSSKEGVDDGEPKKMRMMSIEEVFQQIVKERKDSVEISFGRYVDRSFFASC